MMVIIFLMLKANLITAVILACTVYVSIHLFLMKLGRVNPKDTEITPEQEDISQEVSLKEVFKADQNKAYKFILTATILGVLSLLQDSWFRYYFLIAALLNLIFGFLTFRRWKQSRA